MNINYLSKNLGLRKPSQSSNPKRVRRRSNMRQRLRVALMYGLTVALPLAGLGVVADPFGMSVAYGQNPVSSISNESELISILQSADRPAADKAMACKRLAVYGSEKCAPEVGKLLGNEQLSSWARITLEAIPGKASNDVLRSAARSLQGRVLVGVLNSLGVRRDAEAVEVLASKLGDADPEVASAAAVALGKIGNNAAAEVLKKGIASASDKAKSSIAEGLVLCAERNMNEGKLATAIELYDLVRASNVPQQRLIEATRGAILARKSAGIPMLLTELRAPEYFRFQLGLTVAREVEGNEVDKALAAELTKAPADRAALLLQAMADRPKTVDLDAVLRFVNAESKPLRLSAMRAIARIGDLRCVPTLVEVSKSGDSELVDAAVEAISSLPDEKVDAEIAKRLSSANGSVLVMLIRAAGGRGIDASDSIIKALENPDATVRNAAFAALGDTLPPERLPILVERFVAPKFAEDGEVAQNALMTASVRMPDREVCAGLLAGAFAKVNPDLKVKLLQILGAVGGSKALATVGDAAMSSDETIKDAATRVLGNWMTIDAAPVLLSLSEKLPKDKYQVRAVRGYLRIARQFDMTPKERIAMAETAMKIVKNKEEKALILDALKRIPSLETLKLVVQMAASDDIKKEASDAAMEMGGKIKNQPSEKVQEILSKLPK
jgi:HEAT repeat protein